MSPAADLTSCTLSAWSPCYYISVLNPAPRCSLALDVFFCVFLIQVKGVVIRLKQTLIMSRSFESGVLQQGDV